MEMGGIRGLGKCGVEGVIESFASSSLVKKMESGCGDIWVVGAEPWFWMSFFVRVNVRKQYNGSTLTST